MRKIGKNVVKRVKSLYTNSDWSKGTRRNPGHSPRDTFAKLLSTKRSAAASKGLKGREKVRKAMALQRYSEYRSGGSKARKPKL